MTAPGEAYEHHWAVGYEEACESARAAGNHAAAIELSLTVIRRVIDLVLERMGEEPDTRPHRKAIRHVQEQLFLGPGVFPNQEAGGSPKMALDRLYRATWALEKAQASGGITSLPPEAGYTDVGDLVRDVAESLKTLVVGLAPPQGAFDDVPDFERAKVVVREVLASELPPGETMRRLIERLRSDVPTEQWQAFAELPFDGEVSAKRAFLLEVFSEDAALPAPDGFDFVISTPVRKGLAAYDVDVFAGLAYDPTDFEWPRIPEWEPRDGWVRSGVLAALYDLGQRKGSLDVGAQVVALAYTLALGREMVREYKRGRGLAKVGLCAGFSSDTPLHLGWI